MCLLLHPPLPLVPLVGTPPPLLPDLFFLSSSRSRRGTYHHAHGKAPTSPSRSAARQEKPPPPLTLAPIHPLPLPLAAAASSASSHPPLLLLCPSVCLYSALLCSALLCSALLFPVYPRQQYIFLAPFFYSGLHLSRIVLVPTRLLMSFVCLSFHQIANRLVSCRFLLFLCLLWSQILSLLLLHVLVNAAIPFHSLSLHLIVIPTTVTGRIRISIVAEDDVNCELGFDLLFDPHKMTVQLENVSVSMHADGIAVVSLNLKSSKVNTLGKDLLMELPPIIDSLEKDPEVKSVIFISGKKNNFIAGADINIFDEIAVQGKDAIKKQVMLGLLPGAGGTQRLPKLIGIQEGARPLNRSDLHNLRTSTLVVRLASIFQAKKLKLVDQTCDPGQLLQCALATARLLNKGNICKHRVFPVCKCNLTKTSGEMKLPKRGELPWTSSVIIRVDILLIPDHNKQYIEDAIKNYPFARDFFFGQARKMALKQTNGNYPAPSKTWQIIDVIEGSIAKKVLGKDEGYEMEADAFAELALTHESSGLRAVFFGQTAVKKNPFSGAMDVKKVGVLGAGLMGAGIAEVTIVKGVPVVLKDVSAKGLSVGETNIQKSMQDKVKKKRMNNFDKDVTLSRLIGVHNEM
eukprot:768707-Hanusia_phi.AAC.5